MIISGSLWYLHWWASWVGPVAHIISGFHWHLYRRAPLVSLVHYGSHWNLAKCAPLKPQSVLFTPKSWYSHLSHGIHTQVMVDSSELCFTVQLSMNCYENKIKSTGHFKINPLLRFSFYFHPFYSVNKRPFEKAGAFNGPSNMWYSWSQTANHSETRRGRRDKLMCCCIMRPWPYFIRRRVNAGSYVKLRHWNSCCCLVQYMRCIRRRNEVTALTITDSRCPTCLLPTHYTRALHTWKAPEDSGVKLHVTVAFHANTV